MHPALAGLDDATLARFCRAHGIRRLALFGSQLKGSARPDSDVDLRTAADLSRRFRDEVSRSAEVQYAALGPRAASFPGRPTPPAALIENATRPSQRCVRGTLTTLDRVAHVPATAVLMIGSVVGLLPLLAEAIGRVERAGAAG